MGGRPKESQTIGAIPEGPMPTAKAKWAAIAKWHAINKERSENQFDEITAKQFMARTGIKEVDIYNAPVHKEYIEASLSLAKGRATMWFQNEIDELQKAAGRLRTAGEDKEYVRVLFELASMLKFKDTDLSGLEDSEAKTATEVVDEIMNLLADPAVKSALLHEEGLVAQKVIPALTNASFKPGAKTKIIATSRPDNAVETNGIEGPDKPLDSVFETEDRPLQ